MWNFDIKEALECLDQIVSTVETMIIKLEICFLTFVVSGRI